MVAYTSTQKIYDKREHKEEIDRLILEFLKSGGVIQVLPMQDNTAAIQEIKREWKKELKSKE